MKKKLGAVLLVVALALALAVPAAPVAAHLEDAPFTTTLFAGQDINVGTVSVWNDGTTLYVKYETTGDWEMTETHLHVATSLTDIPQTTGGKKGKGTAGNPIPGHFSEGDYYDPPVTEDTFTFDLDVEEWLPCTTDLYIAAHAVVVRPVEGCWEQVWQIGDVEGAQMDNPVDEFNWDAIVVGPYDFYEGTTPWSEFPWISRFDKNYAPTVNIHFNAAMPFGGQLSFSWSPGGSGHEIMDVELDLSTLGTLTRDGVIVTGWWDNKERFVETFSVDPLDAGEHTLTFDFSSGDGSVWDWFRLEKPCEQEETAWGDGTRFTERGNWATYFSYHIQEPCVPGVIWQIGTPNGAVNPVLGASEYLISGTIPDPDSWVWDPFFDYYVQDDPDPVLTPQCPGVIGPFNVLVVANDGRPPIDATAQLNIIFELYCDYEAGDLVLYYDRYGSEQDDLWIDLDGTPIFIGSPSATEGGFQQFTYSLPALEAGNHSISIVYVGGGSGNGHYIDYLKLVYE